MRRWHIQFQPASQGYVLTPRRGQQVVDGLIGSREGYMNPSAYAHCRLVCFNFRVRSWINADDFRVGRFAAGGDRVGRLLINLY